MKIFIDQIWNEHLNVFIDDYKNTRTFGFCTTLHARIVLYSVHVIFCIITRPTCTLLKTESRDYHENG